MAGGKMEPLYLLALNSTKDFQELLMYQNFKWAVSRRVLFYKPFEFRVSEIPEENFGHLYRFEEKRYREISTFYSYTTEKLQLKMAT